MRNAALRVCAGVCVSLTCAMAHGQWSFSRGEITGPMPINVDGPPQTGQSLPVVPADRPLSSMVATYVSPEEARDIGQLVLDLLDDFVVGNPTPGFPLEDTITDTFRTIPQMDHNVLVKWLDPLTPDLGASSPRFGANCDYIAYFGAGWDADWGANGEVGSAPQFSGSGSEAWIWSNHEYISNGQSSPNAAPNGQYLTHSLYLQSAGILTFDVTNDAQWTQQRVDTYVREFKKELGGAWFRAEQDPATGAWSLVRDFNAVRYDGTDSTLLTLTGHQLNAPDNLDDGTPLPDGVLVGITGDCSGGQTPWGTIITAEENVQSYYGDLEDAWSSNQQFNPAPNTWGPGANVNPTFEASTGARWGRISNPDERHDRDVYGYLSEIDPGVDSGMMYSSDAEGGDGEGHRKIGSFGRARWENTTFVTGPDWRLIDGQPIVMYAGNDRRSGRMYKWVTNGVCREGMTKAEVRALMDEGKLYVSHLLDLDHSTGNSLTPVGSGIIPTEAAPGMGVWIDIGVGSADVAPNADALGAPGTTVGQALQDVDWNGIGGFPTDNDVRNALFTAATKIGVSELNRPEDLEWNPLDRSGTPRLYVAFTNHERAPACDQDGVLTPNLDQRTDDFGQIFAFEEGNPADAASSMTFTYWQVWKGVESNGTFDAANPDNLAIDSTGGVWFGTDGNPSDGGTADAVYYLDLDPSHRAGEPGVVNATYQRGIRVAATPGDAEATGPAFSADMRSLFVNVQHPGEFSPSTWPQDR
jgi:secreted PhoX family phosphatase